MSQNGYCRHTGIRFFGLQPVPQSRQVTELSLSRADAAPFVRGLVGTPDNFGQLGERPANTNLLNWLARQFIADSWSMKHMQRRIVLSSTYSLGSSQVAKSATVDPNNRLQWHTNVRHLEARRCEMLSWPRVTGWSRKTTSYYPTQMPRQRSQMGRLSPLHSLLRLGHLPQLARSPFPLQRSALTC